MSNQSQAVKPAHFTATANRIHHLSKRNEIGRTIEYS